MKVITSLLVVALSVPVSAGIIRHDTPDSWYTGLATDPAFSSVGLIFAENADTSYSCSGTVINKNWVLTAGHCVNAAQAMSFYLPRETGMTDIDCQSRAGTNIIDDLWSEEGCYQQILWSDFDHPTDPSYNFFDYIGVDFDDLASVLEIMIAPSDSGGGVFIQQDGQVYLSGVHSFIADASHDGVFGYGDIYRSTRVSSFNEWIS